MSDPKKSKRASANGSTATFIEVSRKWRQGQFVEIGQAEGIAWKITFHLLSEATERERKCPKEEVRWHLSLSIPTNSLDAQHCEMTGGVRALAEGRVRMRPPSPFLPPWDCTLKL